MKRAFLMAVWATTLATGQKIERQLPDSTKVVRIETARDHLTVIELSEPVALVAVGNRNAFTIERRENKVFVTPAEDGVRTNLFIWTASGRYAYELLPARSADEMHFAIDQIAVAAPVRAQVEASFEEPSGLPAAMLTDSVTVQVAGARATRGRVEVTIRDLFRRDGRLFLRYSVSNQSDDGYQPVQPAVSLMSDARAHESLIPLQGRQLGEKLAASLKAGSQSPVDVVASGETDHVPARGQALGWFSIPEPASSDSTSVLRMSFAADSKGAVEAFLVLPNAPAREVARASERQ